jgi:hypothetical protein
MIYDLKSCDWSDLPDCCKNCVLSEPDDGEFSEISIYSCFLSCFLPFKKQSCKRRFLMEKKWAKGGIDDYGK